MAAIPPVCDFDWLAPDFNLIGVDQKKYNLDSVKGRNGTLIMFICNHCPYVKSILEQLVVEVSVLQKKGVACIAINSNDSSKYPEDLISLIRRAMQLRNHLTENKKDLSGKAGLQRIESKIYRIAAYYRKTGVLPKDWKYRPENASVLLR